MGALLALRHSAKQQNQELTDRRFKSGVSYLRPIFEGGEWRRTSSPGYTRRIRTIFQDNEACQRIGRIEGIGPIVGIRYLQLSGAEPWYAFTDAIDPFALCRLVRAVPGAHQDAAARHIRSLRLARRGLRRSGVPVGTALESDWPAARLIQPVIAAVLPVLAFVAFEGLRRGGAVKSAALILHLIPAALVLGLVAVWRAPIDIVLFAIYLGYGAGLLRMARQGPDTLVATRLGDSTTAHKALVAVALLLILTAFIDAGVSFALTFGNAEQATAILTVASVLWLAAAGYAATVADATRPEPEPDPSVEPPCRASRRKPRWSPGGRRQAPPMTTFPRRMRQSFAGSTR